MNRTEKQKLDKKQHKKNRKNLEQKSEIKIKLQKLYLLNQQNPCKINDNLMKLVANEELIFTAYEKLKANKGSMTPGTKPETADGINLTIVQTLSKSLIDGSFKWSDVRRQMIPKPGKKKKRPLGIPNFIDRIVQENIRVILNIIYEPEFQELEANHGFRPKRSPKTAISKLQRESKEMFYALEGDVQGAYDNVDHKKMIEILSRRISDKKFLDLIERGLKQNIIFEEKKYLNLVGTPQGGIASPILFNIYMNEFDQHIKNRLKEIAEKINETEGRSVSGKYTRYTRRMTSRIEKAQVKIRKIQLRNENIEEQEKKYIREQTQIMRDSKKEKMRVTSKSPSSLLLRFAYSRYADDWIILTNGKEQLLKQIKDEITEFLWNELKLKLDQDKTIITSLKRDKAKYLGFTIFHKEKRIIRKTSTTGRTFRQRSTVELTIGIDHQRVLNRLAAGKIVCEKHLPRSNPIYMVLKPYEVVTKYKQRLEGLFNYYYYNLTYPNELNRYYYIYKFSCLKTLARRMKISISQITMKYGERLEIVLEIKSRRKTTSGLFEEVVEKKSTKFPTYGEIHKQNSDRKEQALKESYARIKNNKENAGLEPVDFEDYLIFSGIDYDIFSMKNIAVNLRSQYFTKTYCSVCGTKPEQGNEIEMHHIKHIRKGKIIGFGQVMKNLNRKTIPVCQECHAKIHKGEYDGYKLKDIFDTDLITT
jgi:group II intron reverse transcriptase/maturase